MITIYTITYNEELLLQFMIDHYRTRFPGCRIVVNDNMSTDDTVKIALANGCKVVPYNTNNFFSDYRHKDIKNNCWKNVSTDWVLVSDLDELLDINETELKKEEKAGTTIIRSRAYDMVDMQNKLDISAIKYGVRNPFYDKSYLFCKRFIKEINYDLGAHSSSPVGSVVYSQETYPLYHYCFINYYVTLERYRMTTARKYEEDKRVGLESSSTPETPEEVWDIYTKIRARAVKVRR